MDTLVVPASAKILQALSENLERCDTVFDKKDNDYITLKTILNSQKQIQLNSDYVSHRPSIIYIQLLFLTMLSMHGGLFIPMIQTVSHTDTTFKVNWGNSQDSFTWGKHDTAYEHFYGRSKQRLFNEAKIENRLNSSIIRNIHSTIKLYKGTIETTENYLRPIIECAKETHDFINDKTTPDQLFVVLSCFPIDQLNALFLHIQSFLPDNLTLTGPKNQFVNVNQIFSSPSPNIGTLISKIHIYFDLYFSTKLPIIRHITESKTIEFTHKLLKNTKLRKETIMNLNAMLNTQVLVRKNMYQLFDTHLEGILKKG